MTVLDGAVIDGAVIDGAVCDGGGGTKQYLVVDKVVLLSGAIIIP